MHHRTLRAYSLFLNSVGRSGGQKLQKCSSVVRCAEVQWMATGPGMKTLAGISHPKSPVKITPKEQPGEQGDVEIVDKDGIPPGEMIKRANDSNFVRFPSLLEKSIQSSKSVEELLHLASSESLILKHAALIVFRLGQLSDKKASLANLQEDLRFNRICNLLQRGDFLQNPQSLFLAIHGLLKLGLPASSELYQSLNSELKWAMRRCPVKHLARAVDLFSAESLLEKYSSSVSKSHLDDPVNIFESAVASLTRRWVEVASGQDFILVFKVLQFLNDETRTKLEDRAAELVQDFTSQEIRMMFVVLGSQKRRPTPLLRALAFHFSKSEDNSNSKDLIDLIYAMNELTFADPLMMEKICSNLCGEILQIENPALISSLVTSLGQMRYKHKGLMHLVDEWITSHLTKLRPFDYAAWLLTSAVLNHRSDSTKEFCDKAKSILSQKTSSQKEWINIVHSLLILEQHDDKILATVLEPSVSEFIEKLGVKSQKSKMKLLNINAVARNKKSGYKGQLLSAKLEADWSSVVGSSDPKLSAVAIETLNSFMPSEKYLELNRKFPSGVFVDATCILNELLEPLPKGDVKKGKYKVAILVESYSGTCLGHKDPTGQTALNRRLLESDGFHPIPLIYSEFSATEKLIRRVKLVEGKIKNLTKL